MLGDSKRIPKFTRRAHGTQHLIVHIAMIIVKGHKAKSAKGMIFRLSPQQTIFKFPMESQRAQLNSSSIKHDDTCEELCIRKLISTHVVIGG